MRRGGEGGDMERKVGWSEKWGGEIMGWINGGTGSGGVKGRRGVSMSVKRRKKGNGKIIVQRRGGMEQRRKSYVTKKKFRRQHVKSFPPELPNHTRISKKSAAKTEDPMSPNQPNQPLSLPNLT